MRERRVINAGKVNWDSNKIRMESNYGQLVKWCTEWEIKIHGKFQEVGEKGYKEQNMIQLVYREEMGG